VHWKSIVTELLWFLRGDTNIKYLVHKGCHIWDGDVYKNYSTYIIEEWNSGAINELFEDNLIIEESNGSKDISYRKLTQEEFINKIKTDDEFAKKWGELGPIYGKQWRDWTYLTREQKEDVDGIDEGICGVDMFDSYRYYRTIDQIANLISELKTNPDSRRLMVNAWNVGELSEMVLPPCHWGFQVYTRELSEEERMKLAGYEDVGGIGQNIIRETVDMDNTIPRRAISLMWNQRSVDVGLGLGFNIASYGLLLEIIAKEVNMVPDELIGSLGDCHLYLDHVEPIKVQIGREPFELPKLGKLPDYLGKKDNWECYKPSDFILENYQSHPTIKLPLSN
jgi:thymidylate synthase